MKKIVLFGLLLSMASVIAGGKRSHKNSRAMQYQRMLGKKPQKGVVVKKQSAPLKPDSPAPVPSSRPLNFPESMVVLLSSAVPAAVATAGMQSYVTESPAALFTTNLVTYCVTAATLIKATRTLRP